MKDMENISSFEENIIPLIQITWLPEVFWTYSMTVLETSETITNTFSSKFLLGKKILFAHCTIEKIG